MFDELPIPCTADENKEDLSRDIPKEEINHAINHLKSGNKAGPDEPLMAEFNESINRWRSLPVSIMGRINILKMNTLPKLLYLYRFILKRQQKKQQLFVSFP